MADTKGYVRDPKTGRMVPSDYTKQEEGKYKPSEISPGGLGDLAKRLAEERRKREEEERRKKEEEEKKKEAKKKAQKEELKEKE